MRTLTAEQRQVLRNWQGTVVDPAVVFGRLLDLLEAVEAERDELNGVADVLAGKVADLILRIGAADAMCLRTKPCSGFVTPSMHGGFGAYFAGYRLRIL
jgi:hypothetical protein